jgi:SET domain-containing protein
MMLPHGLVEIKTSSIHGLGGFAKMDLAAGIPVIEYTGLRIDKREAQRLCCEGNQCIFYLDEQWDLDGSVDWNTARFLNHSCAPNCEAQDLQGRIWIVPQQPIHAGEELTFNYGYDLEDYHEHSCLCGAQKCVGYIVADEFFDDVRPRSLRQMTATGV